MMGWLGPVFMVVFWVAVIVGVVLLIRWLVISSKPSRAEDSALEILKRRYAMGGDKQGGVRGEEEGSPPLSLSWGRRVIFLMENERRFR